MQQTTLERFLSVRRKRPATEALFKSVAKRVTKKVLEPTTPFTPLQPIHNREDVIRQRQRNTKFEKQPCETTEIKTTVPQPEVKQLSKPKDVKLTQLDNVKVVRESAENSALIPRNEIQSNQIPSLDNISNNAERSLMLPEKYQLLEEFFRSIDMTTRILQNRRSKIAFPSLQSEVHKMICKNFTKTHLAQIRAVYPESFEFSMEPVKSSVSFKPVYELMIKRLHHKIKKRDEPGEIELTISQRLKIFHNRLLKKTKLYHEEFLAKLNPPIVVDSDKLTSWHENFDVNSVPDIVPVALPQPFVRPCPSVEVFTESIDEAIARRNENVLEFNVLADERNKSATSITISASKPTFGVAHIRRINHKATLQKNLPKNVCVIKSHLQPPIPPTRISHAQNSKKIIQLDRYVRLKEHARKAFSTQSEKDHLKPTNAKLTKNNHIDGSPRSVNDVIQSLDNVLIDVPESLVLPEKYQLLEEFFRSIDMICRVFQTRKGVGKEKINFPTLQNEVQKIVHKSFTRTHIAEICAVYPESFEISYELNTMIRRLRHKIKKSGKSEEVELTNSERMKIFHNRLLQRTKLHHEEFLSKFNPPIVVNSDKLTSWHQDFDVNNVPDIVTEESTLSSVKITENHGGNPAPENSLMEMTRLVFEKRK